MSFTGQSLGGDAKNGTANVTETLVGDFNGDGNADRAVFDADINHWYMAFDTSRAWQGWGTFYPNGKNWSDWVVGDFNGDGFDDIAGRGRNPIKPTGHWSVAYSGMTDVTLTEDRAVEYVAGSSSTSNYIGDFTGDGLVDILTKPNTSNSYFLADLGLPTAGPTMEVNWDGFQASVNITNIIVADINADGLDDLIGMRPSGGRLEWARSNGVRLIDSTLDSDFPVTPPNGGLVQHGNYA